MHSAFIPSDLADEYKSDIATMFIRGLRMDLKVILIGFAPLLLLGYIALLWRFAQGKTHSHILEHLGRIARRIYPIFSSIYIGIMAILSALFSFIGFYYYDMFKSKIDIFIFGLKDDDTSAIFSIIFKDYPIALIVACVAIFSAFCVWLNNKILISPPPKQRESSKSTITHRKTRIALIIFGNIIFLYAYIVGMRGKLTDVAWRPLDYRFSTLSVINEISTNPIMAFSWAHTLYKEERDILPANIDELNALQNELFSLWQPLDSHISSANPHIMLNIMESFGLNAIAFADESHNFLGALKEHFESDFLFTRFLSSTNNTSRTVSNILSFAQNASIYEGKYRSLKLPLTPIEFYKNLGYKIIAIYSGNSAWYNLGDFLVAQGVDEFIDETTLMAHYPQSKQTKHKFGIADEFAYEYIFEALQNATTPTLIINITISNHKPYYHAKHKDYSHFFSGIPQELDGKITHINVLDFFKTYTYANDEFGKFLTKIKHSKLKDSTIIAATGDHRARELPIDESKERAFAYSVPFYVFVPQKYRANLHYDKNRLGSHKDIFPTLYALSGSKEAHYFSVGGRDMFAKPRDKRLEFGINESVFIDESGIYPLGSKQGFSYKRADSLLNNSAGFDADSKHAEFIDKYNKLNDLQLRARVNGQNIHF